MGTICHAFGQKIVEPFWENKKFILQQSLIFAGTGAISGILNGACDHFFDGKDAIEILPDLFIGAAFGLVSGWGIEAIGHCHPSKCCSKKDLSPGGPLEEEEKGEKTGLVQMARSTMFTALARFGKRPFLGTVENVVAGLAAAFGDDAAEWKWDAIGIEARDLFLGFGIGVTVSMIEAAIYKLKSRSTT